METRQILVEVSAVAKYVKNEGEVYYHINFNPLAQAPINSSAWSELNDIFTTNISSSLYDKMKDYIKNGSPIIIFQEYHVKDQTTFVKEDVEKYHSETGWYSTNIIVSTSRIIHQLKVNSLIDEMDFTFLVRQLNHILLSIK